MGTLDQLLNGPSQPAGRSVIVPYRDLLDLPEEQRVQRRIDELRPILQAAKKDVDAGGYGAMKVSLEAIAPPRFVHELITLLDLYRTY